MFKRAKISGHAQNGKNQLMTILRMLCISYHIRKTKLEAHESLENHRECNTEAREHCAHQLLDFTNLSPQREQHYVHPHQNGPELPLVTGPLQYTRRHYSDQTPNVT